MIAHSSSKDFINDVHRHGGEEISKDFLPPVEIMKELLDEQGLALYSLETTKSTTSSSPKKCDAIMTRFFAKTCTIYTKMGVIKGFFRKTPKSHEKYSLFHSQ